MENIYLISTNDDLLYMIRTYKECLNQLSNYICDSEMIKQIKYPDEFIYKLTSIKDDVDSINRLSVKLNTMYTRLSNQWESAYKGLITDYENLINVDLDTDDKVYYFKSKCQYKIDILKINNICNIIKVRLDELLTGVEKILLYLLNEKSSSMYERIEAYSWCNYINVITLTDIESRFLYIQDEIDQLSDIEALDEYVYFARNM